MNQSDEVRGQLTADDPVIRLEGLTKVFPGVVANSDVNLDLYPGEIVGVLGENGAGKSTLMAMIYGLHQPDGGQIYVDGRPVTLGSARDALALGIGFVQQHFSLVPTLTVAENLALALRGTESAVKLKDASGLCRTLSKRFGLDVDPDARVEDLNVGRKQYAELIKALAMSARILILDEPSAVLTPQEAMKLVEVMRQLAAEGLGIFLISHNLDEVVGIADRITVLRRGEQVATRWSHETSVEELAELMVGELESPPQIDRGQEVSGGPPALEVKDLWVRGERGEWAIEGVDLTLRPGEILGVAGVEGNGQQELTEAIAGVRKKERGEIHIAGTAVGDLGPRDLMDKHGLAHIPADRQRTGFIQDLSVGVNLALPQIHRRPYSNRGVIRYDEIGRSADTLIEAYDIRVPSEATPATHLSGGNQQKMILARELSRSPKIVVACYAARGLDIAAAQAVQSNMRKASATGAAVLYISVELNELLGLCDRIAVLRDGRIQGVMEAQDATAAQLGMWMGGAV